MHSRKRCYLPLTCLVAALALSTAVNAAEAPGAAAGAKAAPAGTLAPAADTIVVRVVSSAECVNTPPTMKLIEATAQEMNLHVEVTRQIAKTPEEAREFRFFGSPTVQIDGLDLEPGMRKSTAFVLS